MIKAKPKFQLTQNSIKRFPVYERLNEKTQMIRNHDNDKNPSFLNRAAHTKYVKNTALLILDRHSLSSKGVDRERLICSALLHDVGHTPYGHAGEDIINELFLSEKSSYYSETGPGVFKHNINSIKVIGDYFDISDKRYDHILIDSILKHSSTFPKKYNYGIFNKSNIIESNYIFDRVKLTKSSFIKMFVEEYLNKTGPKHACSSRSKNHVANNDICFSCKSKKNKQPQCFIDCSDCGLYNLSMYLSYPFPATCEGTILYWADEIACLCGDLFDLCRYLKTYITKQPQFILFSRLQSIINLLAVRSAEKKILPIINECLSLALNTSMNNSTFAIECWKKLLDEKDSGSLRNVLIDYLDTTKVYDNEITINCNGDHCDLLFGFDDEIYELITSIKDAIYQDVHKLTYIDSCNKIGQKRIQILIEFYLKKIRYFFDDASLYLHNRPLGIYDDVAEACYSTLNISKKISYDRYRKKFYNFFKNPLRNFDVSVDSFKFVYLFSNYAMTDDDYYRLINIFKREIHSFVATLGENDIEDLLKAHKLNNAKTILPTEYYIY